MTELNDTFVPIGAARELLSILLESIPQPSAILSAGGRILVHSRRFAGMLGWLPHELNDRFLVEFLDQQDAAAVQGRIRNGGALSFAIACADGGCSDLQFEFRPLGGDLGDFGCLVSAPSRETGLRDSLARMPTDNPNPVMSVAGDGRLHYANEASRALVQHWRCDDGARVPPRVRALAAAALADGEARQLDELCGDRVFELRFQPNANGQTVSIYGLDVSARIAAESALQTALEEVKTLQAKVVAENAYLREEIRREHDCAEFVGVAPATREVLSRIDRVADTDATVLIFGETGTGKELIARAIHDNSKRGDRPLVKVNCAALPGNLIESELFGHERGAFTGANQRRAGRFELADGGTLFLDEIGDLPVELQAKLLRVLQEGEIERLGSTRTITVDVRVIAATNRHLEELVLAGGFREDLYYRLNVFPIRAPALRERREDIPALVKHFLSKFQAKTGRRAGPVDDATMRRLTEYDWPGNVRELENLIERAVILSTDGTLRIEDQLRSGRRLVRRPHKVHDVEAEMIRRALLVSGGVIEGTRGAARELGLAPSTLRERMRRYGISRRQPCD